MRLQNIKENSNRKKKFFFYVYVYLKKKLFGLFIHCFRYNFYVWFFVVFWWYTYI